MSGLKRVLNTGALVAAAIVVASTGPKATAAAPTVIRLATQAPTLTMWDKELKGLGATWNKVTEGRVTLTVYPDGSQGTEPSTITKMEGGSLQAALLTAGGLSHLDTAFNVFTIPFFFETDEQEMNVQKALEPELEQRLQKKGFHLLNWGTGGWVQIFSKKPIKTLDELKQAKLYVSKEDVEMEQWYTRNGFHPVPSTLADIAPALKLPSGRIDTTPNTPYLALMTQIFGSAKYMLDVHIAPLVGATIVTTSMWNQLSEDDRKKMTEAAKAMEARIRSQAPAQDKDSIDAMKTKNLQVIMPDAKAAAEFRAAAKELAATMRGSMVPADIYDKAMQVKGK